MGVCGEHSIFIKPTYRSNAALWLGDAGLRIRVPELAECPARGVPFTLLLRIRVPMGLLHASLQ